MERHESTFDENVFINCPFDPTYLPMLRCTLFTIIYCGLKPRIAAEREDSGEVRVRKIITLIKESKYSIHDLSRIEPLKKGELPRFNMPFELGIDIGCREASQGKLSQKKCLILERDRYRYQRVLSDISGNDIRAHGEDPEKLVRQLRNWLVTAVNPYLPSGTQIWDAYNEFNAVFQAAMEKDHFQS